MKSYEAIKALNWSSLKEMYVSPRNFQWHVRSPKEDKAHFSLGRIIHMAILEPEIFQEKCVKRPDEFDSWRTKASKKWRAEQVFEGKEIMTDNDALIIDNIVANFATHPAASLLNYTKREQIIEWTDQGVRCKGRLDAVSNDKVIDLKTTSNLFDFVRRDFFRYLYHGQVAWYRHGAISSGFTSQNSDAFVIVCETNAPYDVGFFRLGDEVLDVGDTLKNRLLGDWIACNTAHMWPGIYPGMTEILDVPPWAPGQERYDEDI